MAAGALEALQARGLRTACRASAKRRFVYLIKNMMFDESSFPLRVQGQGACLRSVLASHVQLSWRTASGQVVDEDVLRPPVALPRQTACTLWWALRRGPCGLRPVDQQAWPHARFHITMLTADGGAPNLKMVRHLVGATPPNEWIVHTVCAQHRTGNVADKVSRALGVLPGTYCVARLLQSRQLVRGVLWQAKRLLAERLVVLASAPPDDNGRWAEAWQALSSRIKMPSRVLARNSPSDVRWPKACERKTVTHAYKLT